MNRHERRLNDTRMLVRHGATTLTAEDRFAGETDVPLSDDRREQARRFTRDFARPLGSSLRGVKWNNASRTKRSSGRGTPYTFAPAGGESGMMVTARALPVLIDLVRNHAGETVLVVSHKATIRLLVSSLLGFDARRYRDDLDLKPASITIIDFNGPSCARLTLFDDTSHYAQLGNAIADVPQTQLSRPWNAG